MLIESDWQLHRDIIPLIFFHLFVCDRHTVEELHTALNDEEYFLRLVTLRI